MRQKTLVFQGCGTAMITPFTWDGGLNLKTFDQLIDLQLENGTDALIVCGTTGEPSTMDISEEAVLISHAVERVAGRKPVVAGAGSNDTSFAIRSAKQAKSLGADALLLVTPYYNKTSQKGLVESFDYIADTVKMPCILYNVPSRTGCNIQIETYCELAKNPYVVAVKEASGNAALAARIVAQCGDNLTVYSGEDNMTLSLMALGGKGVISVFSNALPRQMHDLAAAMLNGDLDTARALNNQYLDLMDGFFLDVNPIPIKEALYQMGLIGSNFCRLPLTTMTEAGAAKLTALLKKHQLV